MCRLLAYSGPSIALNKLISEPEHSLVVQSYAPREMTAGRLNADGFGFAWYDSARQAAPFVYRNILPIWSDSNLDSLAAYVTAPCILANVRSATPGQALDFSNTQPFVFDRISVIHNGFIEKFAGAVRRRLRDGFEDETHDTIRGTTDSEHLFGWLIQHVRGARSLGRGLGEALASLAAHLPEARMTLNFILSDGRSLAASRHALGGPPPSLYVLERHARFPDAVLIASEPLFDDPAWRPVPAGHLVTVDEDRRLALAPLAG
ncbi:MAG: ergothioneine biosynthesis protein EgtC [Candidatus Eiseniibacteriota bacterium]